MTKKQKKVRNRIIIVLIMFAVLMILDKTGVLDPVPWYLQFVIFLIPYAMKYIGATTVSVYTNLQTIVASFVAIIIGQDILTWDKPVALVLVLLSAYIVNVAAAKSS